MTARLIALSNNWKDHLSCGEQNPKETTCHGCGEPTTCADCDGHGSVECDEFQCHGEFCDFGKVTCESCRGTGLS